MKINNKKFKKLDSIEQTRIYSYISLCQQRMNSSHLLELNIGMLALTGLMLNPLLIMFIIVYIMLCSMMLGFFIYEENYMDKCYKKINEYLDKQDKDEKDNTKEKRK